MRERRFFTITEFAKFSRTTRNTLLHYDKIGLLSPALRDENNYREYTSLQIDDLNFIRMLQELGMTLEEIKKIKDLRTPAFIENTLRQQIENIDTKIEEWVRARKLLLTLQKTIQSAIDVNEDEITVEFMPAEAIVLGELNDYSRGRDDYDAFHDFYLTMSEKYPDLDLNYPVWGFFSQERIKRGDWRWPDRFYFYNPEGHDKKPASLYVIGYTRGGYGQPGDIYKKLLNFISANGYEFNGDVYEEYPHNEVCISDEYNYLMRVMIPVREREIKEFK